MLSPKSVEIDARDDAEMLHYMYRVAEQLKFFTKETDKQSWSDFLYRTCTVFGQRLPIKHIQKEYCYSQARRSIPYMA